MTQIKNVVVFGDSFTELENKDYLKSPHWILQLARKYDWNLTSCARAGSGPWWSVEQFTKYKQDFDLCIFAWSEPLRFWHQEVWDINTASASRGSSRNFPDSDYVYETANNMYMHGFWDRHIWNIKMSGVMRWFDAYTKQHYPNKHFWHFNCFPALTNTEQRLQEHCRETDSLVEDRLFHEFEHGTTVYPSLVYLSDKDPENPGTNKMYMDTREGHLSTLLHDQIFEALDPLVSQTKKSVSISQDFKNFTTLY